MNKIYELLKRYFDKTKKDDTDLTVTKINNNIYLYVWYGYTRQYIIHYDLIGNYVEGTDNKNHYINNSYCPLNTIEEICSLLDKGTSGYYSSKHFMLLLNSNLI